MSSQEQKKAGDDAWGKGNFQEAIDHYGKAINVETGSSNDKNVLKVLYSNRSAAYLKVNKSSAALLDADKCVELDSQWPKGLVRKGDALYAMSRYVEAYNCYNAASRVAPNDQSISEKRTKAENAISASSSSTSSSSGWSSSTSTSGASSSRSSNSSSSSRPSRLSTFQHYCRVVVVLGCLLYLLPLPLPISSGGRYKMAAAAGLCSYLIALYVAHGMPQFSSDYAQKVVPDPSTMYAILCVLVLGSRPYITAIAPVFITEFTHLVHHVVKVAETKYPELLASARTRAEPYLAQAFGGPGLSADDWRRLSPASKWSQFNSRMSSSAVQFEVMHGLCLLVELLMPSRNVLLTVMWWQFLQMRYMMDRAGDVKNMFRSLDGRISQILAYQMCPQILRTVYGYVKTFLAKQVEIPQPGAGPQAGGLGSMLSKCTIM